LEFDISRNLIFDADKDAILNLFETVQGSQDYFLFEDFTDYQAFHTGVDNNSAIYPSGAGYERGGTQGVMVRDIDNNLRLAKLYQIGGLRTYRVITHPNQVTVYRGGNPVSVSVEQGTGIVTNGQDGDTWTGTFYVPVRFVDDDFSFSKVGDRHYAFSSLKMREVKLYDVGISANVFNRIRDYYFALAFNFNSDTSKRFKTIVDEFDNSFENREQQYDYLQQRFTLNQRKLLTRSDVEYLITLYRCHLGAFTVFKYYRFEDSGTFNVSLESPLELQASMKKNIFNTALYEVSNLVLKSTSTDDIEKLRTTYCKTWQILPKDGGSYGITDFDQDIVIGVGRYKPISSFKGFAVSNNITFDVDQTELEGVFLQDWITEEDLLSRRFEDARVIVEMVDWTSSTVVFNLFRGFIGNQSVSYSKFGARAYKLEGVSMIRDLNKTMSNVTSSRCRHKFLSQGYAKCNKSFSVDSAPGAGVRVRTTVTSVINNASFTAGSGGDNWQGFARGVVLFETGKLEGQEFFIKEGNGTTISLLFGMTVLPDVGDTILVTRDCPKTIEACRDYNNAENFGGFPRMPGFDGVIAIADV
jgi:uncharacterized phage protein (TIGR02218 family)